MPCYTVQTVSVEFKVAHRDLLDKALRALKWPTLVNGNDLTICPSPSERNILLNLAEGQAVIRPEQQPRLNELKRAYSQQAIKLAAKLNGWQLKSLSATKGLLTKGVL